MHSHLTGGLIGARLGNVLVAQSFPILFSDPTAVARIVGRLQASVQQPVVVEGFFMVEIAADGTTHSLAAAIGATALSAGGHDMKAAVNTVYAVVPKIFTADADITVTPTMTGTSTVGKFWLVLRVTELNVDRDAK